MYLHLYDKVVDLRCPQHPQMKNNLKKYFNDFVCIYACICYIFFTDSLEDQEGGAMYISCDVSNGGPVEPETGYVPNNPLFGLALDSPQVR